MPSFSPALAEPAGVVDDKDLLTMPESHEKTGGRMATDLDEESDDEDGSSSDDSSSDDSSSDDDDDDDDDDDE